MKGIHSILTPIFLVLACLFKLGTACGVTTHIVIGHRATSNYDMPLDPTTNISQVNIRVFLVLT